MRKYGKLIHKLRSRLSLAQAEAERFKLEKVRKYESSYTVKKLKIFLSPAGMSLIPYSIWPGIILLFPARKSLVSDISAVDGKMAPWENSSGLVVTYLLCDKHVCATVAASDSMTTF